MCSSFSGLNGVFFPGTGVSFISLRWSDIAWFSFSLSYYNSGGCFGEDAIYRFVSERNYPHCAHKEICISRCLPCTMGPLKCTFFSFLKDRVCRKVYLFNTQMSLVDVK